MKSELIFVPLPAAGHLASSLQLAKLLVSRDDNLTVRILVFRDETGVGNLHVESLFAEATQGIQFTELQHPQDGDHKPPNMTINTNPFIFLCELMESYKPQVMDLVANLNRGASNINDSSSSSSSRPVGFVLDMFTTEMMDVANHFDLPAYMFYTSGAATLGFWLRMNIFKDGGRSSIDMNEEFSISTYKNPVPAKLFPSPMFTKEGLEACVKISSRMVQAKGILVNTFQDLESYALEALSGPPVYTVGPLINLTGIDANRSETEAVLAWLDDQPNSSVVFLCFGSLGCFDKVQAKEIANALENHGCRFLWSLRTAHNPSNSDENVRFEEVLPEGFLQRTSGVGKVIGWAPQVRVLGHRAVGGFVTHCGWNSVLESVWFGVPMAAWPMYAEQHMNALQIVKDIRMAVEVKMDYNVTGKIVVLAEEIEKAIGQLMQNDGGEMKKMMRDLMGKARDAMLSTGGSSYVSLGCLMEDLRGLH